MRTTHYAHLRTGAERSGRLLDSLDIGQGVDVAFARDEAHLAEMIDARRPGLAFSLGDVGSGDKELLQLGVRLYPAGDSLDERLHAGASPRATAELTRDPAHPRSGSAVQNDIVTRCRLFAKGDHDRRQPADSPFSPFVSSAATSVPQ